MGLGNAGDILIAINKKMKVIILTGLTAGKMDGLGSVQICIPSYDTQRIQECHLLVEHILCEFVEASFMMITYDF